MNVDALYKYNHMFISYIKDYAKIYVAWLFFGVSIIISINFLLYLFNIKSDSFFNIVMIIAFIFFLSLFFTINYVEYKDTIKMEYYNTIILDFEEFISTAQDKGIDTIYISRKFYSEIRHYILLYHTIKFVIDPYRDGNSYGVNIKKDIINTIEDIL